MSQFPINIIPTHSFPMNPIPIQYGYMDRETYIKQVLEIASKDPSFGRELAAKLSAQTGSGLSLDRGYAFYEDRIKKYIGWIASWKGNDSYDQSHRVILKLKDGPNGQQEWTSCAVTDKGQVVVEGKSMPSDMASLEELYFETCRKFEEVVSYKTASKESAEAGAEGDKKDDNADGMKDDSADVRKDEGNDGKRGGDAGVRKFGDASGKNGPHSANWRKTDSGGWNSGATDNINSPKFW